MKNKNRLGASLNGRSLVDMDLGNGLLNGLDIEVCDPSYKEALDYINIPFKGAKCSKYENLKILRCVYSFIFQYLKMLLV